MYSCGVALATAVTLIATADARLSSSKKHFDMAAAKRSMGAAAFVALNKDAKCKAKASQPTARCMELCQGKADCASVCNEVRNMICDAQPVVVGVTTGDQAAASAAAAAAASSAVKAIVKDALADAKSQSEKAAADTKAAMTAAIKEAKDTAKLATSEAAANAHAVAYTAAAAAASAAKMVAAPAKGK